jgi:hypothetical protein
MFFNPLSSILYWTYGWVYVHIQIMVGVSWFVDSEVIWMTIFELKFRVAFSEVGWKLSWSV